MQIKNGEFVSVMGPSGSGKSTLLYNISGMDRLTSRSFMFNGHSKSAGEIMEILAALNQSGTTILLVTHDIKVAAKTERVLFMLDGKLVAEHQLGKYIEDKHDIRAREEKLTG